jgi:hypothetical protein
VASYRDPTNDDEFNFTLAQKSGDLKKVCHRAFVFFADLARLTASSNFSMELTA